MATSSSVIAADAAATAAAAATVPASAHNCLSPPLMLRLLQGSPATANNLNMLLLDNYDVQVKYIILVLSN